jgi:hypothetical protein
MKVRRYMVSASITVRASTELAFTVASDPGMVLKYERGITRIDLVRDVSPSERVVRTHLRLLGISIPFEYRYRYSAGRHYSGVQEGNTFLRGFFSFSFEPAENGTRITHREGVSSRLPFVANVVGWFYFRLMGRDGIASELVQLKALIENIESTC